MTDAETYESYNARQDEESYRRQLFLLGAAFGNPDIASKLSADVFSDVCLQDACEQVAGRKLLGVSDYVSYFANRELGIQECEKGVTPIGLLKLVAQHCRADAGIQSTLRGLGKELMKLEWQRHKTAVEKQGALSRGRQLVAEMHKAFEGMVNAKDAVEPRHEAPQAKPDEARR